MVKAEGRSFPFDGVEAITPGVLETFPYGYAPGGGSVERSVVVEIGTDEFTAVCPFSGLPDFGSLEIRYIPQEVCVELKSLKYYICSYRNVGIYQEHAVNRILDDVFAVCSPSWMEVVLDYGLRGGIHTVVTAARGDDPEKDL